MIAPPVIPIIGLSGKAGCGKDTLGREALRPMGYSQFSLAWPMKNEAVGGFFQDEGVFSRLVLPCYKDVHIDKPPAIRSFLQRRGTEEGWMKYGKDYWCRIAEAWMITLKEHCGLRKFYVPDVRFPHEVSWIEDLGGIVIRITGRGGLQGAAAEHASETALDGHSFRYTVDNSGHLDDAVEEMIAVVIDELQDRSV